MAATKTPAVKQTEMKYVGFWVRTGAWFIDLILLAVAALGLVVVAYFIGLWAWRKPMDLGTAVLRFIGYVVCVLTLGIGFLMIAFDEQKRGLHDRLAGTYVIPFTQG